MEWRNNKHNQEARILYMVINYYLINLILGLIVLKYSIQTKYEIMALSISILIHGILGPNLNLTALELDFNLLLIFSYSFPKIFQSLQGTIYDPGPSTDSSFDQNLPMDDQRCYLSYPLVDLK